MTDRYGETETERERNRECVRERERQGECVTGGVRGGLEVHRADALHQREKEWERESARGHT